MDLFPAKTQFLTGENVDLILETAKEQWEQAEVSVFRLNDLVLRQSRRPEGGAPFFGWAASTARSRATG